MKPKLCLVLALLITTAHRLPAPIQEISATPTPLPSAVPLATATPAATELPPTPPAPPGTPAQPGTNIFAGRWTGKMMFIKGGEVDMTLAVNSDATALEQVSKLGNTAHSTVVSGRTLSWQVTGMRLADWTLTPSADGQTAVVTRKMPKGALTSVVFQRAQPSAQPGDVHKRKTPGATPASNKPAPNS